jgi:phosphohistidine phosphatase
MRHADALPATTQTDDIDRELSPHGINQLKESAEFLSKFEIDQILVSPSNRTRQTLDLVLEKSHTPNINIVDEIYTGSKSKLFDLISQQSEYLNNLMLIGHNPNICSLGLDLSKADNNYDFLLQTLMPTASIIVIDFLDKINWYEIPLQRNQGCISHIFIPE